MKNCTFSVLVVFLFSFLSLSAQNWEAVGPDDAIQGNLGISNGYGENATIEFGSDDMPFLAYSRRPDNDFESSNNRGSVKRFNGNQWVLVGKENFTPAGTIYQDMALSGNIPYVFYVSGGVQDNFATVSRFNGSTWEKVGAGNVAEGQISLASITIADGIPYVAYADIENNQRLYVKKLHNGQWIDAGNSQPLSNNFTNYIDLKTNRNGEVYISYTDSGLGHVKKLENDSWQLLGGAFTVGSALGLTMTFDINDIPYVAYGSRQVSVQRFVNGAWEIVGNANFIPDFTQDVDIEIDANNTPYIFYAAINNDRKARSYKLDNGVWQPFGGNVSINLPSGSSSNKTVDLALDSRGNLYATYSGPVFVKKLATGISAATETTASLDENGKLVISDSNGGDSDDEFILAINGENLRIQSIGNSISISGNGTKQIGPNTVEVPLVNITGGIVIDGGEGLNTLSVDSNLSLIGTGNDLTVRDTDVLVTGTGIIKLNTLNVYGGDYDTSGLITEVTTVANFFEDSAIVGNGTLLETLNMNAFSTIAPGTSPGILNTGDLTLTADAAFSVEVNGPTPGTEHDQIKVTGTVDLGGALLDINREIGFEYSGNPGDELIIIDNDGTDPITGTFADLAEGAAINEDFVGAISYTGGDGNDVVLMGEPIVKPSNLIITEIMFNPLTESNGEWIEIYNNGLEPVDLTGYVLDDNAGAGQSSANMPQFVLMPDKSVILYDDDLPEGQFTQDWGTVDAIAMANWPSLNNAGDTIGIWDGFEDYVGDNENQANVIEQVVYDSGSGWPSSSNGKSIFLIALDFDNTEGGSWSLSSTDPGEEETPLFNSYESTQGDIGSPGTSDSIADEEAPMFICPEPIAISTDLDSCEASFYLPAISVSDNVSAVDDIMVSITRGDGFELTDPYPKGETTITITATDEAENSSEPCTVTITVTDDQAPEIICTADIVIVGSDPQDIDIAEPTVTDNCMAPLTIDFERSDDSELTLDDLFTVGKTSITWTAMDGNNNTSICVQTITIGMGQSMESNIVLFNIPDQATGTRLNLTDHTVKIEMPPETDLSSLTPSRITVSEGATVSPMVEEAQDFTEPVIYTITAADGSTQEWAIEVTIVEDGVPPVFVDCEESIVLSADPGQCLTTHTFVFPTATDDVDDPSLIVIEGSFNGSNSLPNSLPVGESTIIWTAKDRSGNISECIQTFTVEDNEDPIALCQDITVQLNAEGIAEISPENVDGGHSDNCGIDLVSVSPITFTEEDLGENEVTVTVTDLAGNISTCSSTVMVLPFENNGLVITSFTLINADTDKPINIPLIEGTKIDINDLPTLHLDIRSNTTEDVESVRISLDGALTTSRTESLMPFALYRDLPIGDYIGEDFVVGAYAVSAIPYSENGLGGDIGEPQTINFELFDSTPTLSVTSFTLINADTDLPIDIPLTEGAKIDINDLRTTHLDIRANTTDDVESVRISLGGALMTERTESLPPYALYRDLPIGDYIGEEFVVGNYAVSAIPYSQNGLAGDIGSPLTLNFELVDGNAACSDFEVYGSTVENPSTCEGNDGFILISFLNAVGSIDIVWNHDNNLNGASGIFDLAAGEYSVTATDDGTGCSHTAVITLTDPIRPQVTLTPFPDAFDTDEVFELSGGMPKGGNYDGDGVADGMFDPSIGLGTYEITYTYIDEVTNCGNSAIQEITVKTESSNKIITYWLVNADDEMDLFPITNGMPIDVSTLPTQNLDIRAETGADTESVGFELTGTQSITRDESVPPYALFQDLPIGDYIGHDFDLGGYTLTGTPFDENRLQGNSGESLTIDFEFVDSTPTLAVTSFTLIDAETDLPIDIPLADGSQLTLEQIETLFLDIRADTTDDVESVRLELSGQQSTARTESLEPYALFRDLPIDDYIGNNFEFGIYTVTATPYSGNNLSGEMGTPLSITFEIVDDLDLNNLTISPNQATTLAKASFDQPTEIKQILIFDMSGRMIETYNPEYIKSGDDYILDVNFYQQGTYIVKMLDNKGVPYQKQMVVKR